MDFEEMQQEVRRLRREVDDLKNNPERQLAETIKKSLLTRTQKTDQFTTTSSFGEQEEVTVNHNNQYDIMLQLDLREGTFVIGAYRANL